MKVTAGRQIQRLFSLWSRIEDMTTHVRYDRYYDGLLIKSLFVQEWCTLLFGPYACRSY